MKLYILMLAMMVHGIRGHTSNYGVGCVISVDTGLAIDYSVVTKCVRVVS